MVQDPALLFDATRQLVKFSAGHDASGSQNSHGVIVNPGVRRKERKGAGAKLADASTKAAEEVAPKVKAEPQAAAESSKAKAETPSSSAAAKKSIPSLKRGGSSGIMESFAKAAAKPKKKETPQPATPSGAAEEESSTRAMSDDGEDDAELLPKPRSGAGRKSRKDREEELRRMMDDNEDEDEEPEVKADSPDEEPVEEEPVEEEPGPPEAEKEELAEMVSVSTGDGRRRGKRRVMRKKQIMDEQGYLGKYTRVVLCDFTLTIFEQSRFKNLAGNLSRRTNLRRLPSLNQPARLRRPKLARRRRAAGLARRKVVRGTSCLSSPRSDEAACKVPSRVLLFN